LSHWYLCKTEGMSNKAKTHISGNFTLTLKKLNLNEEMQHKLLI
jgi:hypothetical protein